MKHLCTLLLSALFFSSTLQVYATSTTSATVESPRVGTPNNDKSNTENKGKGNTAVPIPTAAVTTAPAQPTVAPPRTNQNTTITPSQSTRRETTRDRQETGSESPPATRAKPISQTQQATSNTPSNQIRKRQTSAVLGTSTQTPTKKVTLKQQGEKAPVKKIIAPSSPTVQMQGVNYYQDERLSPTTTKNLLYVALTLFFGGMFVLNFPTLYAAVLRLKQKLSRTPADPITIPYIDPTKAVTK